MQFVPLLHVKQNELSLSPSCLETYWGLMDTYISKKHALPSASLALRPAFVSVLFSFLRIQGCVLCSQET